MLWVSHKFDRYLEAVQAVKTCPKYLRRHVAWIVLALSMSPCLFAQEPSGNDAGRPEITVLPGFKVEHIYTVPHEQGSWVSLSVDPKGRLLTSDQAGSLYRITLQPGSTESSSAAKVEAIHAIVKDEKGQPTGMTIGSAQGLLWAFDSLYVVVNGRGKVESGLYRVRSSNGGDALDEAQLLTSIPSSGEHGPHGLALAPDGKNLYLTGGNDCGLPPCQICDVPRVWGGDQLTIPDVQGQEWHSKNGVVPGGWIARADPDGKSWEIVCAGMRNSYRLAFNSDGEIFTTDNDDEWQMGLPWYRAPRICHVQAGADFGWRSNSAEWPTHYPDGLDGIVNLPRGGPSGVLFGTGAKFPARYQRALFAADWAYGKIYAAHLQPIGASYSGTTEVFLSGKPLAIADAVIGHDGALYFVVGGREIQSALYRVVYVGTESTAPVGRKIDVSTEAARSRRRAIEALLGRRNPANIDAVWINLDDPDAAIRVAARAALEAQDVALWQERVFTEARTQARLTAAMALARCGAPALEERFLRHLDATPWPKLTDLQRVELLRTYALTFIRMGKPAPAAASRTAAFLNAYYPSDSPLVDLESSRVLSYLDAPGFIDKTLGLNERNLPQECQMQFGMALSMIQNGWTAPQRERFVRWLKRAAAFKGGRQVLDTLARLKTTALETAPEEQRATLKAILGSALPVPPPVLALPERKLVKEWNVENLMPLVKSDLHTRNYERGHSVYVSATCINCHYFNGEGADIGPDLTSVAWRFDKRAIVESIVDPSKVISDQFALSTIKLDDGRRLTARIRCETNGKLQVCLDAMKPDVFIDIEKASVRTITKSPVSTMPVELLNTYSSDAILDLLAFLVSGGDPNDKVFQPSPKAIAPAAP